MNDEEVQKLYVEILRKVEKLMDEYRNAKDELYKSKTITDIWGTEWRRIDGRWIKWKINKK